MHQLLLLLFFLPTILFAQHSEADHIQLLQQHFGGQREVAVTSGRVDILTDTFALEVEFANKWKQAIGQALWYAQQTNRQPGIVLLLRKKTDYKYSIQLQSTLSNFGLDRTIKVWVWPNDFPNLRGAAQAAVSNASANAKEAAFWMTSSSGIRHNSGCRYFKATRGRACSVTEGRACKKCGG